MSPSTRPSQRLPPLWAHSLPRAKISSPRRKSATSRPFTIASSTPPSGRDARAKAFTRGICSPSPCPLPLRGRGKFIPSPLWGEGRVRGGGLLRILIGLVENLRDVQNLDRRARGLEALSDLDDAPGIGSDHGLGARPADMSNLPLLELARHLGLRQVVRPCRAAAPVGFLEGHQREPGDLAEQRARLPRYLLPVHDVAGIVVGHRLVHRAEGTTERLGCEELGEVAHLG